MEKLRVSIITVSYNSSATIADTIRSVESQTYPNIEHIIIDGASTDGTVDIIKHYGIKISKFISEPDHGIYDAMNKGLKLSSGDIIGILNSDDLYIDNSVIEKVVEQFEKTMCDALYGDLYYVQKENTDVIVRKWHSKQFVPGSFRKGWHPPHPTFFVKNDVYSKYGYFDLQFKLAADFELMLRFLENHKIKQSYLPRPLIKMRLGGATNKNLQNIIRQNIECYDAFKKNSIQVSYFYPVIRLFPKVLQYIKR